MEIFNTSKPIVNHYIQLIKAGRKTIEDIKEEAIKVEVAGILGISLEEITLEKAIEEKVIALSEASQVAIVSGTDIQLTDGTIKHYSFTAYDQANIKNLFDLAILTKTDGIPYHADNGVCELYSCADIIAIYVAEQKYILYHNTYFNTLKQYVKTLTTVEEVEAVTYGMELNEEYAAKMNDILTQSSELFDAAMKSYGISA